MAALTGRRRFLRPHRTASPLEHALRRDALRRRREARSDLIPAAIVGAVLPPALYFAYVYRTDVLAHIRLLIAAATVLVLFTLIHEALGDGGGR